MIAVDEIRALRLRLREVELGLEVASTEARMLRKLLRDMTDRFERVCADAAGNIDVRDAQRIRHARAAMVCQPQTVAAMRANHD